MFDSMELNDLSIYEPTAGRFGAFAPDLRLEEIKTAFNSFSQYVLTGLVRCFLLLLILLGARVASAQTYHLAPLRADAGIKRDQVQLFDRIIRAEAGRLFTDGAVADKNKADADLRPLLRLSPEGTKLIIERLEQKQILSVIEVSELEALDPAAYPRIAARALRDAVYGRFQLPMHSRAGVEKSKASLPLPRTVGVN